MKRLCVKLLGILLITIMLLQTLSLAASDSDKLKNEQSQVNSQIEDKKEELEGIKAEKSETMSEVETLTNQITDYQNQIDDLDTQIGDLTNQISEAEKQVNQKQEDYDKNKGLAEERLVVMQEAGETSYLDFILNSGSLVDMLSTFNMVSELAQADMDTLENLEKEKQELEKAKETYENAKRELDTSKAQAQSLSTQLQATKEEKNQKVAQLSEDEKSTQAEIDELVAHEASIKSEMARLKAEYDKKLQQQNANKGNSSNSNSGGSSNSSNGGSNSGGGSSSNTSGGTSSYGFGWPVSNHTIGTRYGVSGSMWSSGYHTGVDFPVGKGTAVYAVGDGQVFDTGYNSAYGNFVEIYHGNNIYSFYAHASSVSVRKGQTVSKGQQIMLSGATGNVSGPHLHFEIRTPGYSYSNCVNPMKYLP